MNNREVSLDAIAHAHEAVKESLQEAANDARYRDQLVWAAVDAGVPQRDIAAALGVNQQRVSRLASKGKPDT